MGIIGGIIGVAILFFIIFLVGTATLIPIYTKLQRLCAKDPYAFRQAAYDETCWEIDISATKHSAREGWSEFIPYPGNSPISIWLRYNHSRYMSEKDALNALFKRANNSIKAKKYHKTERQVLSFSKTNEVPKEFPPIGSTITYRWFQYAENVHMDGHEHFVVKQIYYDQNVMLLQMNNGKFRTMKFKEFVDIYTNPILDCYITLPS